MNRNKRNRYKSLILELTKQIKQEQLILAQGEDSKEGQLIYLMQKGSFQVICTNDQISIRDIKETQKLANKHFEPKSSNNWSFL